MITIAETVHEQPRGRLEPTYVRYHVKGLEPQRFTPVRLANGLWTPSRRRLRPQVAGVYGKNRDPRDRMRHDWRWRGRKCPTVRYTPIDRRWR